LLSKVEGAAWALDQGVEPETVRAALAAQRGAAADLRREEVQRLVAGAREALSAAAVIAGDGGPGSR
jgi:hypothetical protein